MRSFCFVLVALCGFCNALRAENITVRTADHRSFTRIAIDTLDPESVEITRRERSITIKFPRSIVGIDTDAFFNRITRTRIGEIFTYVEQRTLLLKLMCDCIHETFIAGKRTFVIDISSPLEETSETEVFGEVLNWPIYSRIRKNDLRFSENGENKIESEMREIARRRQDSAVSRSERGGKNVAYNSATDRLHLSLDQALKDMSNDDFSSDSERVAMLNNEQIALRSYATTENPENSDINTIRGLSISDCKNANLLNPSGWGDYREARDYLVNSRRQVAFGFEDFSDSAARLLATAYLSLAMGAEAKAIIESISNQSASDKRLLELAQFTDGNISALSEHWFEGFENCSDIQLWQVLSVFQDGSDTVGEEGFRPEQLTSMRAQFEQWPAALKGVFGPRLAIAFSQMGARDAAIFSLRKSENAPSLRTGERELATASVNPLDLDVDAIEDVLSPVAFSSSAAAPKAMISLAEIAVDQDKDLGTSGKDALLSYQNELKGTELEPELLRARILTAIQSDEFEEATKLIFDYAKLVRPSKVNIVLDALGLGILEIKANAMFLKEAVSLPAFHYNKIAEKIQSDIKERVRQLGFEDLAEQLGRSVNTSVKQQEHAESKESADSSSVSSVQIEPKQPVTENARSTEGSEQPQSSSTRTQANKPENEIAAATSAQRKIPPLAQAIQDTQLVLEGVAELKKELLQLGVQSGS